MGWVIDIQKINVELKIEIIVDKNKLEYFGGKPTRHLMLTFGFYAETRKTYYFLPTKKARRTTEAMSGRRSGANWLRLAMVMPMAAGLEKPHNA